MLAPMVKNPALLKAFEEELARQDKPDYHRNLKIYEAMYQEARSLGIFPLKDPLDGIEVDIRLARALNVRKPA